MATDRVQRQINGLLNEAEEVISQHAWTVALERQKAISLLDESLAISSELSMRPLMERVLSRRDILRA